MTTKFKFAEGEKVLCFHGPLIYEAKALKSTVTKDKQIKYYIHYAGWNKNWDEWVPENRVLKFNDNNVQRQKEVYKLQQSTAGKSKKATPKGKATPRSDSTPKDGGASSGGSESRASTPSKELNTTPLAAPTTSRSNRSKQTSTPIALAKESEPAAIGKKDETKDDVAKDDAKDDNAAQKKKRVGSISNTSEKSAGSSAAAQSSTPTPTTTSMIASRIDSCVESEEGFLSKIEVKIKIPDELKQCLADDWDAITRQHKLIFIPAKVTVQDIIDQYIAFKKASKTNNATKETAIIDVLNGIKEYFNVMLGSQLLYKYERPQYAEIVQQHPDTPMTQLYGAFHLLRLFVKLGTLLGFSELDEKSMQMVLAHMNDFLKFLVKNSATYFNMSVCYVNVAPEYLRHQ